MKNKGGHISDDFSKFYLFGYCLQVSRWSSSSVQFSQSSMGTWFFSCILVENMLQTTQAAQIREVLIHSNPEVVKV